TGRLGATFADFFLQVMGVGAYSIPILIMLLGWMWIRSTPINSPWAKSFGSMMLVVSTCAALGMAPAWRPIAGAIPAGGQMGSVFAEWLVASMNTIGALLVTSVCWIVSLYLVSTFEMSRLAVLFRRPLAILRSVAERWRAWRERQAERARERAVKR